MREHSEWWFLILERREQQYRDPRGGNLRPRCGESIEEIGNHVNTEPVNGIQEVYNGRYSHLRKGAAKNKLKIDQFHLKYQSVIRCKHLESHRR